MRREPEYYYCLRYAIVLSRVKKNTPILVRLPVTHISVIICTIVIIIGEFERLYRVRQIDV